MGDEFFIWLTGATIVIYVAFFLINKNRKKKEGEDTTVDSDK